VKRTTLLFVSIFFFCIQAMIAQENSTGSQHVYYVDNQTGHVHEMLWTTSSGGWINQDLTVFTGAPLTFTKEGLTSFHDSNGIEVFYESNGNIHELYWNPGTTNWVYQQRCGGCALSGTPLSGFVNDTGEHVFYMNPSNYAYELHYIGSGSWSNTPIAAISAGSVQAMSSYADGSNSEHLFLIAGPAPPPVTCCDHLYELYFDGSRWAVNILAADASAGSGIAAIYDSTGEEVFYMSGSQASTVQMHWNNGWSEESLPGYSALGTDHLAGFANSIGEHFFYIQSNQHVHELFYEYSSNTWMDNDLSNQTGITAQTGSNLTGFSNGATDQHLYLLGAGGNLYEFHWPSGGSWVANAQNFPYLGQGTVALSSFVY
jgi:hypothetical protein